MRVRFRSYVLVLMLIVGGLLATNCGGGAKPSNAPAPTTSAQSTGAQSTGAPSAAQPKRGGTLINVRNAPPLGFDPHQTLTWSSITYASPVFSQLIRVDPTKGSPIDSTNLVGDLAERWEISPDGKTMTFFLRKGVKFHNGQPFTSKDVKWSIARMMDPKISFIAGEFSDVASVETPDDFTVKVIWKNPAGGRIAAFAMGYSVIMSADYHPGKDRKKEEFAMGTGPFKLTKSTSGKEYVYERNPDYFIKDRPYLDSVIVRVVSTDALLPAMISGQGDTCSWVKGCISNDENAKQIESQAGKKLIIGTNAVPRPLGRSVYFNVSAPGPTQNADVRRAMALVLDPDAIVARYGGSSWAARSGYFIPGMALDVAEVNKLIGWDKPIDARVKEAKELLSKAGVGNGFKGKALVRNTQEYIETMTLISEAWKKHLNIEIALDTAETATEVERRSRFDYTILFYFPTMKAGIHPVELGSQFTCNQPENWARLCNKEIDALFDKMAGVGGAEAKKIAQDAERLLFKEMPAVPLLFPVDRTVAKPEVKGNVAQTWLTNEDYSNVWLDR